MQRGQAISRDSLGHDPEVAQIGGLKEEAHTLFRDKGAFTELRTPVVPTAPQKAKG